jgi:hypothetical protein
VIAISMMMVLAMAALSLIGYSLSNRDFPSVTAFGAISAAGPLSREP